MQIVFGDYKALLKIHHLIINVLQIRLYENILTKLRMLLIISIIKNEIFLRELFLAQVGLKSIDYNLIKIFFRYKNEAGIKFGYLFCLKNS